MDYTKIIVIKWDGDLNKYVVIGCFSLRDYEREDAMTKAKELKYKNAGAFIAESIYG